MYRYRPSYNVSHGSNIPVVRREDGSNGEGGVVLHCMKWGLIPSFSKKTEKPDHYKMVKTKTPFTYAKLLCFGIFFTIFFYSKFSV